jgi:hypothetical protein
MSIEKKPAEGQQKVWETASREKRPYRKPSLTPIGSVRELTLKTGSVSDHIAGRTKHANNPN